MVNKNFSLPSKVLQQHQASQLRNMSHMIEGVHFIVRNGIGYILEIPPKNSGFVVTGK